MREERRREQTKLLNKLKGIEVEEEEEIEENSLEPEEKKKSPKIIFIIVLILLILITYSTIIETKYIFKVNEFSIKTNKIDKKMNGLKIVT